MKRSRRTFAGDLAGVALLALLSTGLGLAADRVRARPLPWSYQSPAGRVRAARQADNGKATGSDDAAKEIRLDDFQQFVAELRGPILDARAAPFYEEAHVPGALNLAADNFIADYERLQGAIEEHRSGPIVIYCSGADCPDAQRVADDLTQKGYQRLLIYTSGWDEWSRTGLPQETSPANW